MNIYKLYHNGWDDLPRGGIKRFKRLYKEFKTGCEYQDERDAKECKKTYQNHPTNRGKGWLTLEVVTLSPTFETGYRH